MAGAKEKLRTLVAEERQEGKQGKESSRKIWRSWIISIGGSKREGVGKVLGKSGQAIE